MARTVSPPRPSPFILAPSPPHSDNHSASASTTTNNRLSSLNASPTGSGTASFKTLLSDRGSWMAPPSVSVYSAAPQSSLDGPFDSPTRAAAPSPAFHFPHHPPLTPRDSSAETFLMDQPPLSPPGVTFGSPRSLSESSYSPSPSIASVRTAKIGTRVLPTRAPANRTLHAHTGTTTSIDTDTTGSTYSTRPSSDEPEARPAVGPSIASKSYSVPSLTFGSSDHTNAGSTPRVSRPGGAGRGLADPFRLSTDKMSEEEASKIAYREHRRSASVDSHSSAKEWKANLDAAFVEISSNQAANQDPRLRPEVDAMGRMTSILGPKMKIISKAPWDDLDLDLDPSHSPSSTSDSYKRSQSTEMTTRRTDSGSGSAGVIAVDARKERVTKENVKPKSASSSTGRSRSFSVLSSRHRDNKTSTHDKELDDALVGLGLGAPASSSSSSSSKLSSSPAHAKSSFLDMSDSRPLATMPKSKSTPSSPTIASSSPSKKGSAPPNLVMHAFPSSSSVASSALGLPSPPISAGSSSSPARKSASRHRVPPPVAFDIVGPTSSLSLPPASPHQTPHSAPAHMISFPATDPSIPRSPSGSGSATPIPLTRLQTSASVLSISSNTSASQGHHSSSTASPLGSNMSPIQGMPGGVATGASHGPGYKLISLEEARQREILRIAAAAAHRKAMQPVEFIAGRDDASDTSSRVRESSGASTIGARSGVGSGRETPLPLSVVPSGAASSAKSLKSKKSGFLKRMMGGEKAVAIPVTADYDDLPTPTESFRALPDDYVHSPSVTFSSPSTSTTGVSSQAEGRISSGANRVAFLSAPSPDPSQRLRKGLAPSLSLRPISMAFSAGLPSDFLAEQEAAAAAASQSHPTQDSESHASVQSPLAPSFHSTASTKGASSIFDSDSASFVSSVGTPLTPAFSPNVSSPKHLDNAFAGLQEEFLKAKRTWKTERLDLEAQIRTLKTELDRSKAVAHAETEAATCEHCGTSQSVKQPESILARPRFKGSGGTGALFSSLVA